MKGKDRNLPEFFRKKGFYIALYSTVAIMLSLAVVVSLNNNRPKSPEPSSTTGADGYNYDNLPGDNFNLQLNDVENPKSQSQAGANSYLMEEEFFVPVTNPLDEPVTNSDATTTQAEPDDDGIDPSDLLEAPSDEEVVETEPDQEVSNVQPRTITAFNDESMTMLWPVVGDVVMGYSADHSIYDITLEQYRINKNICISAPVGTVVRAGSDGVVKEVNRTRETGNSVVLSHGNGWETTYSQLQDTILVSVGDVVSKGQVIGGVSEPTIYGVLLGSHLEFTVTRDAETVNPETVLAK